MKIDEIIKKSIEIPGISIKRGEFSASDIASFSSLVNGS